MKTRISKLKDFKSVTLSKKQIKKLKGGGDQNIITIWP